MNGDLTNLVGQAILVLVPLVLSLTVHEFAHAQVAKWLGDDTAERQGRLNLNPVAHADLMGTVVLPMMILLARGSGASGVPFIGWAKPVPVDASRFRRTIHVRRGLMLVAAAGPLSNLVLAILCLIVVSVAHHTGQLGEVPEAIRLLLQRMVQTNVGLAIFNLLPIYPLDGHKVLSGLLPAATAEKFDEWNYQFGNWALIGVIVFGGTLLSVPIDGTLTLLVHAVGLG